MVSFMFSFLSAVFGYSFFGVLSGLILAISGVRFVVVVPVIQLLEFFCCVRRWIE